MDAPLQTRVRAAHLLSGLLFVEAAVAAAGVAVAFLNEEAEFAILAAGLAGVSLLAGVMEWRRHVRGEAASLLVFVYGVSLSILALPTGLWYYVPWLGVVTLGVMLALLYRFAVRSESRHGIARHT